jgi:hypothetical protein
MQILSASTTPLSLACRNRKLCKSVGQFRQACLPHGSVGRLLRHFINCALYGCLESSLVNCIDILDPFTYANRWRTSWNSDNKGSVMLDALSPSIGTEGGFSILYVSIINVVLAASPLAQLRRHPRASIELVRDSHLSLASRKRQFSLRPL